MKPSPNTKVQGKHYDFLKFETIEVIEAVVRREELPRESAYCIGNALKHLLRAGLKEGEDWMDDVEKAENYLHRATTGDWKK